MVADEGMFFWLEGSKQLLGDTNLFRIQAQNELHSMLPLDQNVPVQAYTDLIKASWILIDIISKHPQQKFISSTSGNLQIQVLAEVHHIQRTML